jgi:dimethylaniline monooxygenase (N-oxide forming)
VIADNVDVHRADIISFHSDTLELSDSSHVPANVLVCATGWESSFPFLSSEQKASLGLPVQLSDEARSDAVKWQALDVAARKKVLHLFPRLADAPSYSERQKATTPYRLYKNMAPLTDNRTILFLGCVQLGNHFMTAEGQALWAVAYFDARLDLPKKEDMEREVAETNMWCRLRYPAKGWDGTFYFFDSLPYVDALLRQVGLKSHQRLWPMTKVAPVKARDLMPLVQEYIAA